MFSSMDAVVLAAGNGARMGGPKARLVVDDAPLALRHWRRLREAGAKKIVVVARPEDVDWLVGLGAEASASTAPEPGGSLAVGVRALGERDGVVLITPVDTLPASVATIEALCARVAAGAQAATPVHGGRGGHPVVVRRAVLDAYRHGESPPLRDVLSSLGEGRARVAVDDEAVVTDLDAPEDLLRLTGARPRFA
jgi:molybdenum cofactor cytidylyltransferase